MNEKLLCLFTCLIIITPLSGSIFSTNFELNEKGIQLIERGQVLYPPTQDEITWSSDNHWWEYTTLDSDRNGVHDSLQNVSGIVNVGLSYSEIITDDDRDLILSMGYQINQELHSVNSILIGSIDSNEVSNLSEIDGVIMVERYGSLVFYGDVQTPSVKAKNSTYYPGAWDLGVSGQGVNIALTDTGVDEEHPGLNGKFVAGYDAVCFLHSDPTCILAGGRETDGSFNPDDGNQHGTACMGMAAATGIESDGTVSNFTGSAPNASTIDVRIGTDAGAGPFENYILEQEFYESAMNGLQWIIDHKDDAWQGAGEDNYGIDIISLSWGITSHETGGSDGTDMHSRILDEAMEAGITVSAAAGNDGPNNDGLSGMGSSSLSITVGATDDQNSINRDDDSIADYSSRGPRRDNGNGNPLDELKPEISAPGSNIIQAEGCVSSGQCNNNIPGQDATENTYTSRGSGTSYATPSVSGIIALMIEANGDLNPLQIKEILKQTSERKGEPSFPEIDPYWNRDFGYGMVDAYAAVSMAIHLKETSQSNGINPFLQNHLLNQSMESEIMNITGHSWGQDSTVEKIEYRIDRGGWIEATYSSYDSDIGALTPFLWHIILDSSKLEVGVHELEIHASFGESNSLPIIISVEGTGSDSISSDIPFSIILIVALIFGVWLSALIFVNFNNDAVINLKISNLKNIFRYSSRLDEVKESSNLKAVLDAELIS
ncbi:MAG: S8 family peptidase [Candidatus Poseidoniales archaeon]|jgi:serine protease AprX|tara:strand:- start:5967 stop:8114 length:2148 start_codon:yes stop_codon:yes gene_type:complete